MSLSKCLVELSNTACPVWKALTFLQLTCSNPIGLHLPRYELTSCGLFGGKPSGLSLNFLFHTLSPLIYLIIKLHCHLFLSLPIGFLSVLQILCGGKPFLTLLLLLDLLLLFPPHGSALQPTDSLVHPHFVREAELPPRVLPWGLPFLRKFFHLPDSHSFPCTMLCIVFMLSIIFKYILSWLIVSLCILMCKSERVRFFADYYCTPDHLG